MRPESIRIITLCACALCAALACSIFTRDDERLRTDFKTEGFIYPDVFQGVVRAAPESGCRGLVACRESARLKAESTFTDSVTRQLVKYRIESHLSQRGITDRTALTADLERAEKTLYDELIGFARDGERAFEYYDKDFSSVIVFRIKKSRLQKKIEALEVIPARAEPSKEEKK
ncbi:MAG: hypothetical protein EPN93_03075 [Spirochaetes bacterium]|nr:MAG: hypothetical protein EPN93_03075 [Spirochaetota bacterium]